MSESRVSYGQNDRVLVVDDHEGNRLLIAEQLHALGIRSVLVADGPAALAVIAEQSVALVLMDCHMPGMDGYETTRCIREREARLKLPCVPVIAISAATDAAHLRRCMECGMDSVLQKPLHPEALRSMLGVWLDQALPAKPSARQNVADLPRLDMFKSYRISFEESARELDSAMARQDFESIAHLAHRMVGAALMVAAVGVAREARHVEFMADALNEQGIVEALEALRTEIANWIAMPRH